MKNSHLNQSVINSKFHNLTITKLINTLNKIQLTSLTHICPAPSINKKKQKQKHYNYLQLSH